MSVLERLALPFVAMGVLAGCPELDDEIGGFRAEVTECAVICEGPGENEYNFVCGTKGIVTYFAFSAPFTVPEERAIQDWKSAPADEQSDCRY